MRARPGRDDDGHTLLETLVSLGILATVLAALTLFYLASTAATRRQADAQAATQLAVSGMERVSLLTGAALLAGRTEQAVRQQVRAPGVDAYLDPAKTALVWQDPAATGGPAAALSLPTSPQPVLVGGAPTKFRQSWYVGECWRPASGGDCVVVPADQRAGRVHLYRVVVAVTWPSRDCPGGTCAQVTAMLRAPGSADPTFGL
ncbi:type IV pilus modification PilV family protein [Spirilliplanes yamanashiensis]|uniref:Uncharacterized protein n=1 Tax=Spirilliplanes yamanashiensis TaxID=42233 RepID=A0A8J4DLK2_9ACTN|nr:type II secretion system protein [Spirilliplanes yamanashiensis]MDP9815269.1 type II secretory pathway pseudopilin PulG [Spirilliplanes yamanashiensis]GIJ06462.1 hypothetical protein Sya03_58140 [Spirilliplanes yamanashiensis]